MLLELERLLRGSHTDTLGKIISALTTSTRETDITGWYENGSTIGVIFTEVGDAGKSVASALLNKVTTALGKTLSIEQIGNINLSFHVYPEESGRQDPPSLSNSTLYPDLNQTAESNKAALRIKRFIDIAGSIAGILLCAPLFAIIAISIKLTSKGPVFFRQQRLGRYGKNFTFLKFRSMYVDNDHTVHKEYVTQFIRKGIPAKDRQRNADPIFKLTKDSRITPTGRFLRRTSLDELPQLLNVIRGDMSLVGPRPPLPYEFDAYEAWHKRRLLPVKPGLTGLWQVVGRSRVTFDEMVRLDLKYAESWCLWLDLKLLLLTPRVVMTGKGGH
jgi:lipopolysaccharide/colanic/teichoic acid biosynthesis glycosyltransferase